MFIVGSKEDWVQATVIGGDKNKLGFYQIPAGAKVKVEFKFKDGHYIDTREDVEVYNSNQKVAWCYQLEASHGTHLVDTFSFRAGNEYKTFNLETLEFISKGWVYIDGWNMPKLGSWISDSAPGADVGYLKVSYSIQ